MRNLVVVLGDQLNRDSAAFDDFDSSTDSVWMAEVREESRHVPSHKARSMLFLSAMRHFRDELLADGLPVRYRELDDVENRHTLPAELAAAIDALQPERVVLVEPGEYRLRESLADVVRSAGVALDMRADRHFLCSHEEFAEHANGRKQLRLEYFYREWRRKLGVLMTDDQKPVGGKWNYDSKNRGSFGKAGPDSTPPPKSFPPDEVTQNVISVVESELADNPGSLATFDWPVTRELALEALHDFVEHRLPSFGAYQDAMWTDEPWLYHSRLSAAMNLKLLNPLEVIEAAEAAYHQGTAPLFAVEGFIRQVLGWREYVRGIYWRYMPDYLSLNALNADLPLPSFYWTADTEMLCLREAIRQTFERGYAHHIQRLMVTGLFALLLGVNPVEVHQWYLSVYVDAVEWVELPNTLGMSQFGDGGVMASKPYAATGKYIQRMSNYCDHCRFDPSKAVGEDACPFTTLYWDFLDRHEAALSDNQRMALQLKNWERKPDEEQEAIRQQARRLRTELP